MGNMWIWIVIQIRNNSLIKLGLFCGQIESFYMLESFDMMVTDFPYHEKSDIRYTINFITKLL